MQYVYKGKAHIFYNVYLSRTVSAINIKNNNVLYQTKLQLKNVAWLISLYL